MNNIDKNNRFEWYASGNAPLLFPTELVMGNFLFEDLSKVNIPESTPFANPWGKAVSMHLLPDNSHPVPKYILIAWLSIVESKFYMVADELPQEKIKALLAEKNEETNEPKYNMLIAGMAPYGKLAIWLSGSGITTEAAWLQGKEAPIEMKDFAPKSKLSKEEYARQTLAECKEAYQNFKENGLPDPMLFEQYMQKFNYKITPKFENETTFFKAIEINYYNGELNTVETKKYDPDYAMQAKPSKIVLKWSDYRRNYTGCFFADEKKITEIFHNYFGDDTQKEGNLIIEADASYKKFQFSLQSGNVSVEIPIETMQYIVFKNKFELCRSKNYNKSKGEWRS